MNLYKFSMLMPVTENVIHFLIQSCFSPLLLLQDLSRGKGRQDYILSAFEKLAFCLNIPLSWCLSDAFLSSQRLGFFFFTVVRTG